MLIDLEPLTVTISGSFKRSKAQIDKDCAVFESRGIKVLSPEPGGLYNPIPGTDWSKGSYPLLDERHMDERLAKRLHLKAIKASDYLYVENASEEEYGYLGNSVTWEMMTALIYDKPIFARKRIDPAADEFEPKWLDFIDHINVMPPEEAADLIRHVGKPNKRGLYIPENLYHQRHGCTDHMLPYEIAIYNGLLRNDQYWKIKRKL